MPVNVAQALRQAQALLKSDVFDSPKLDAEILLAHILEMRREDLFLYFDRVLTTEQRDDFHKKVEKRAAHIPMAHILGHREFWSLEFEVSPATLIPRPDSETLVEAVVSEIITLKNNKPISLLDLGTGSGCLLLSIMSEFDEVRGMGVDASAIALEVAQKNAKTHKLNDRTTFKIYNWMSDNGSCFGGQKFDILISNPPYIKSQDIKHLQKEVSKHDPLSALDGGADGLDHYRRLAVVGAQIILPEGLFFLEIGSGQEQDVESIFAEQNWLFKCAKKDLSGIIRVLCFQIKNC